MHSPTAAGAFRLRPTTRPITLPKHCRPMRGQTTMRVPVRICITLAVAMLGSGESLPAQSPYRPAQVVQAYQAGTPVTGQVVPVQYSDAVERPLDASIAAMPANTEELEVIHHRSQLMLMKDSVWRISVTDPAVIEVVQYSPTEIAVLGVGEGTTDLWIWFEGRDDPLMYLVSVIPDPSLENQRRLDLGKLERKIQVLYPNSKVYLIPLSRKIIVRGQATDPAEAAQIMEIVRDEAIDMDGDLFGLGGNDNLDLLVTNDDFLSSFIVNELQVPGEFQIMMHVRIAELNRSQLRRMGVDWDWIFNNARHRVTQTFAAANPLLTGIFENGEIAVAVDALASNGTAKIISNATLVTLSGEPASFLAGGEFAVPSTVGLNGVGVATTTFRGFGTSIVATPTIIDHDLIRLEIIPELSEVDQGNAVAGVPGVNVKRVQTRVQLREGQTIVLGGMFSRQQQAEITRIPWLGELPIVGTYLFNAKQATEEETELLILVSPEIVRPMDSEEVPPMPGFYVTHPDDFDLCKFNRTEGNPDLGHYQLLPYGNGQGYGQDAGFSIYNGAPGAMGQPTYGANMFPSTPQYAPQAPQPAPPATNYPPPTSPTPAPPTNTGPQANGFSGGPAIQQTAAEQPEEKPSMIRRLFRR